LWGLGAGFWGTAAKAAAQVARSEKDVYVGDSRIRIVVAEVNAKGRHGFIYFHPHENEHGSAAVTRHTIREFGGRLVEIRSQGEQLVKFRFKGVTYSFDPNRMFTDAGLESSLAHFAPISQGPLDCARNLRNAVLSELGRGKTPIIAVHNNAPQGISALYYQNSGMFAAQAARVVINPAQNPHDFFVVLDERLFRRLHHAGFNTVLQAPNAPDDGSLAVFCQQHHWPYVSVEAADSDMNQQQRMLEALPAAIA
jgi:hypothetical protein